MTTPDYVPHFPLQPPLHPPPYPPQLSLRLQKPLRGTLQIAPIGQTSIQTSTQTWDVYIEALGPIGLGFRLSDPTGTLPSGSRIVGHIQVIHPYTVTQSFVLQGFLITHPHGYELRVDPEHVQPLQELLGQLRKQDHIRICTEEDVEASDRFTGFSDFTLIPRSLPELALDEIDIRSHFLGQTFQAPLLITGMTGGTAQGEVINRHLAEAAHLCGIPMGVGSQRIALENPAYAAIFQVKRFAPKLFVLGNIGATQLLRGDPADTLHRCRDMIQADALAIHVNVLQECLQVEGDRDFRGLLQAIEKGVRGLQGCPVVVKEVGFGLSPEDVQRLVQIGVSCVDVGGKGGTSWGYIEGLRSHDPHLQELAQEFRNWGIPTAYSLVAIRKAFPELSLIGTGGIRSGLMVAKACALGANMVGIGLPLFRAALESSEAVFHTLERFRKGLKIAMLASGCHNLQQLPHRITRHLNHESWLP